ncbi:hypothetical protein CHARACLAT_018356 [Characodon lateralis]|uniref:Uncharacterized protein n=1 Tax=Characodon lateralis TaxID=208331 RepID=A0ABU7DHR6_9TELE|nr:hypothetical protein [Characodon lateralis]
MKQLLYVPADQSEHNNLFAFQPDFLLFCSLSLSSGFCHLQPLLILPCFLSLNQSHLLFSFFLNVSYVIYCPPGNISCFPAFASFNLSSAKNGQIKATIFGKHSGGGVVV